MTLTVLAASLFCIVGAGWYHQVASVYTTVNVDVNPSVCLYLNRQEKVLSMEGINKDGKNIVAQLNHVSHEKIEDVLSELIDQMTEDGYLSTSETNAILISVDMKNSAKAEEMVDELSEQMYQVMDQKQLGGNIVGQTMECNNKDIQDLSEQLHISQGKATFIKEISDKNSNVSQKELANMKMTEIIEVTEEQNVDITTLSRSPKIKKIPCEPSNKTAPKETQSPITPEKPKTTGASNQSSSSDKPTLINTKQEEEQRPQQDNKTNPDTKRESAPNNDSEQKDSNPHSSSDKNKPNTQKQKPSADEKQLPQSTQQLKTSTPPEADKKPIESQEQSGNHGNKISSPKENNHSKRQPDVHQKEQTPEASSASAEFTATKEPAYTVVPTIEATDLMDTPGPTITPAPTRKPKQFPDPHFPFGTISLLERWF